MIIYTIDDEPLMLKALDMAVTEAEPQARLCSFSRADAMLLSLKQGGPRPDVVFLDIEMPGMGGLALARQLKILYPKCWIVFVTGYSQYATEAFSLHAKGYVLKPVSARQVRAELDDMCHLQGIRRGRERVRVQTFGNFEVFIDDKPLKFSRMKAKELFAYLVHQRGANCTTKELAAVLFEDQPYDRKQLDYLQKLVQSMLGAFADANADEVIVRGYNQYAVNTELIDCDYYRFTRLDPDSINLYTGEYMSQYSWAEMTSAYLSNQ